MRFTATNNCRNRTSTGVSCPYITKSTTACLFIVTESFDITISLSCIPSNEKLSPPRLKASGPIGRGRDAIRFHRSTNPILLLCYDDQDELLSELTLLALLVPDELLELELLGLLVLLLLELNELAELNELVLLLLELLVPDELLELLVPDELLELLELLLLENSDRLLELLVAELLELELSELSELDEL